jgi:hypothetical protein
VRRKIGRALRALFFLNGLLLLSACGGTAEVVSGASNPPAPAPIPAPTPAPTYSASVSWTVPLRNTDGSALTDVSGYRVYYGTSPSNLSQSVLVSGDGVTSVTITGLAAGTYYFAVATQASTGQASIPSALVSKTVP